MMKSERARAFIRSSRDFVHRLDEGLREILIESRNPLSIKALVQSLTPTLGSWKEASWGALRTPLMGHLEALVSEGKVEEIIEPGQPAVYRWKASTQ